MISIAQSRVSSVGKSQHVMRFPDWYLVMCGGSSIKLSSFTFVTYRMEIILRYLNEHRSFTSNSRFIRLSSVAQVVEGQL